MYTNKLNGHKYIGQTVDFQRRHKQHCKGADSDKSLIDKAFLKYGNKNFNVDFLVSISNMKGNELVDYLNEMEKYYIWKYNTFKDPKHYNLTEGGGAFGSGENHPLFGLKGENSPNYGSKRTKIARENMSKNHYNCSGKNNPMYGRCGKNNPNYKDYARVIKDGKIKGTQRYALVYNGKKITHSLFKDKLEKKADELNGVIV